MLGGHLAELLIQKEWIRPIEKDWQGHRTVVYRERLLELGEDYFFHGKQRNKLRPSLWEEFCFLAVHEKKWWLVPILISLSLIAVAVAFRQTATVPFIYRLF